MFLHEIGKALADCTIAESTIMQRAEFLREMLALTSPRQFTALLERFELESSDLDTIKTEIYTLNTTSTERREMVRMISLIPAATAIESDYI